MRQINLLPMLALFLLTTMCLTYCESQDAKRKFGIFKVLEDNITVEMDGEIGNSSLKDFTNLVNSFPGITKINIKNCMGSSDDETNLKVSLMIHQKGINIHLMDNGTIASGGVDLFLAGIKRTKGVNTKIGVHSWAGDNATATDFPVGHANHLPYINYYVSIGFTQQQAENFYYFTINSAPASSVHWMTETEIALYNIIN